jgi:hypothetical protein
MISAELYDRSGAHAATAVLHKGRISVRTDDRALETRLIAFFHAPQIAWVNGERRTELAGSEAHFEARLRAIHHQGLTPEIARSGS